MIEVDTNILVRHISQDDEQQSPEATAFLANNLCMVLQTVLLETVWVLGAKSGHGWERSKIIGEIREVLGFTECGRAKSTRCRASTQLV